MLIGDILQILQIFSVSSAITNVTVKNFTKKIANAITQEKEIRGAKLERKTQSNYFLEDTDFILRQSKTINRISKINR